MKPHFFDLSIRVLHYIEDGECVAHALELDLVGTGETFKEAEKDLVDAIVCQVTFAAQQNDPDLLAFPAPPEYFEKWEAAQNEALKAVTTGTTGDRWKVNASAVQIPARLLRQASKRPFTRNDQTCLA